MAARLCQLVFAVFAASALSPSCFAGGEADPGLTVVIVRHGEKPKHGENLTCQGENRAQQLPAILHRKFGKFDHIYVPTVASHGDKTLHSRMFQTATPAAIRNDLEINSQFPGTDTDSVAKSVLEKKGTVLLVWNHTAVAKLAQSLGANPPVWKDWDYDSIWVITYPQGKAVLRQDAQKLSPSTECAG